MELIDFCNNNTQLTIPMERWNDLFVDTLVNLDAAIGYMAQYLSTRIVYVDMRKEAVEGLYVPSPSKSRVSPLLEQIFPKLITLCNFCPSSPPLFPSLSLPFPLFPSLFCLKPLMKTQTDALLTIATLLRDQWPTICA